MSEKLGGKSELQPIDVLDLHGALARLGGDEELFAELVAYVLDDAPELYRDLQTAVTTNDANSVRMKAHALKGLVAGCGGERTVAAAQLLEDAGHSGDLRHAAGLMDSLNSELSALTDALQKFRR